MAQQEPSHPSVHVFIVRIWQEPVGDGRSEWRGKMQHVPSGRRRYFRTLSTLMACVAAMLSEVTRPDNES